MGGHVLSKKPWLYFCGRRPAGGPGDALTESVRVCWLCEAEPVSQHASQLGGAPDPLSNERLEDARRCPSSSSDTHALGQRASLGGAAPGGDVDRVVAVVRPVGHGLALEGGGLLVGSFGRHVRGAGSWLARLARAGRRGLVESNWWVGEPGVVTREPERRPLRALSGMGVG